MRVTSAIVVGLALAFSGCGGCGSEFTGPAQEIASESVERMEDTWHVAFVTTFDAPVDKVYEAYTKPERAHELSPDNILKSEVASEEGNVKVIDLVGVLDILPPGFKTQSLRTEYTFFPDEKRITSRSVEFNLADIESEFRFEPNGEGTVLHFTQTSKDKAPMLVESLQKGALRETYIRQVRIVNKALGLSPGGAEPKS